MLNPIFDFLRKNIFPIIIIFLVSYYHYSTSIKIDDMNNQISTLQEYADDTNKEVSTIHEYVDDTNSQMIDIVDQTQEIVNALYD